MTEGSFVKFLVQNQWEKKRKNTLKNQLHVIQNVWCGCLYTGNKKPGWMEGVGDLLAPVLGVGFLIMILYLS
jgi:hypothetical protein